VEEPVSKPRRHWQKILLREWRHCKDKDYARELFALISPEPVAWWAMALGHLAFGAFYGLLGGLEVGLVACQCVGELAQWHAWLLTQQTGTAIMPFLVKGIGIGGGVGLVLWLLAARRPTWGRLLHQLNGLLLGLLLGLLGVTVGGLRGVVVGVMGAMPNPDHVYARRFVFFWWRRRPLAAEVEAALRAVASTGPWVELLHRLDTLQGERPTLWIALLSDSNWGGRGGAGGAVPRPPRAGGARE
jgi:hypothetical protein